MQIKKANTIIVLSLFTLCFNSIGFAHTSLPLCPSVAEIRQVEFQDKECVVEGDHQHCWGNDIGSDSQLTSNGYEWNVFLVTQLNKTSEDLLQSASSIDTMTNKQPKIVYFYGFGRLACVYKCSTNPNDVIIALPDYSSY